MHKVLIEAAYKASREQGTPISKEHAEFICEDLFAAEKERDQLRAEVERLTKERDHHAMVRDSHYGNWQETKHEFGVKMKEAQWELKQLRTLLARAREALVFYRDSDWTPYEQDMGDTARAALTAIDASGLIAKGEK